jgi:hypothetical protein
LHHVAHISDEDRFVSLCATASPSASDACHPSFNFASTLADNFRRVDPAIRKEAVRLVAVIERGGRMTTPKHLLDANHPRARFGSAAMPAPATGHGIAMPESQKKWQRQRRCRTVA